MRMLTVSSIGFFSIEDPGPPATNYCNSPTALARPSTAPSLKTWSMDSMSSYTVPPAQPSEAPVPLVPTSTLSSGSINTSSSASTNTNSSQLTGGAKAAVGIFSAIAVLALAALLLFLFRRRRGCPRSKYPRPLLIPYDDRPYSGSHGGSRTPLITPPPSASSRNVPLIPPAKLSDRKYLEPVVRKAALPPSVVTSVNDQNLPSSIRARKQSGPIPLHERRATANTTRFPKAIVASTPSCQPPNKIYSPNSGSDTATIANESNKASSVYSGSVTVIGTSTPPLPSPRFPRGRDGTFESGLVTPAGPPPSSALPAPPPNHPNSPTFSISSVSPRSPTFPARALTRGERPIFPTPPRNSAGPSASISTQELCDLTETYAQETRESWGSWSGVGGGGPGVVPLGRKRGSAEKKGEKRTVVPLQELDLEKLSGRY
ncbi:hypothetical protein SAMD00023353_0500290 [Rosellinia necatrix]|uniref:Uncharacterized protein n=1 Tax=Rosellinia necatrix TaxID=77044 RepID=A0A1S8A5L3_ROSNE|nr:hypothetical protein SAMD00023353_0500290 [Rosellinia necatrix]